MCEGALIAQAVTELCTFETETMKTIAVKVVY